jgi:DnaJ-related protein SCJ1
MKHTLTLIEALVGFEKTIHHLDDAPFTLSRSGITQYGHVQTIKGKGMPVEDNETTFGDLFVEYHVILPNEIDSETIECKVTCYSL